ncbi:hypothetical protein EDB80DRAFT_691402 [Ilyonectria destructans]|nr:hypothetical protein EDB80DRAFT_691402 [Ilyonectria destructans]
MMGLYVQQTLVENRGTKSPWGQNFKAFAGWFKAEDDDQAHLTYDHDGSSSHKSNVNSTVVEISPRATWTNPSAYQPSTKEWVTQMLELGLKRTEQTIEDWYYHLVFLLPFLVRPKAFGLRNLFSTHRLPLDANKWLSMIPEGHHSCFYCQNLFIDARQLEPAIEQKSKMITMADVNEAVAGDCTVFKWLEQSAQKFSLHNDAESGFSLGLMHRHGNRNDIPSIKFTSSHDFHEPHGSMRTFVSSDAPAAEYINGRPLNSDVASEENFELSSKWLEECHRAHVPCRGSNGGYMPTRVLKIEGDKVNLMETEGNQEGKYAALSYCWGGSQDFTLTTVTGQEHERGRVRLGQNDCLQGEKEIPKESSDLSYLHNIHKVRLFIKYESHMIVPSQLPRTSPHFPATFQSASYIRQSRTPEPSLRNWA